MSLSSVSEYFDRNREPLPSISDPAHPYINSPLWAAKYFLDIDEHRSPLNDDNSPPSLLPHADRKEEESFMRSLCTQPSCWNEPLAHVLERLYCDLVDDVVVLTAC